MGDVAHRDSSSHRKSRTSEKSRSTKSRRAKTVQNNKGDVGELNIFKALQLEQHQSSKKFLRDKKAISGYALLSSIKREKAGDHRKTAMQQLLFEIQSLQ